MVPLLSQLFFELVECIRLDAYWLSTAFLDNTEYTCLLIDLVFTNVDMLLVTVNWPSFKVRVRIQHPARINDQIDRNGLKY